MLDRIATPTTQIRDYLLLTDNEKEQVKRKINAKFADNEHVIVERINRSGIPKHYRNAQPSKATLGMVDKLRKHEIAGLILRGETGRGKTYESCAILLEHLKAKPGKFATMNDILARVRGAYSSNESPEEVFGRYKGTSLLVIDDLGKENISLDSITKLFELLDTRIANEKPTVITTQFTNSELMQRYTRKVEEPEMVEAILSRLLGFAAIDYYGRDRRA